MSNFYDDDYGLGLLGRGKKTPRLPVARPVAPYIAPPPFNFEPSNDPLPPTTVSRSVMAVQNLEPSNQPTGTVAVSNAINGVGQSLFNYLNNRQMIQSQGSAAQALSQNFSDNSDSGSSSGIGFMSDGISLFGMKIPFPMLLIGGVAITLFMMKPPTRGR